MGINIGNILAVMIAIFLSLMMFAGFIWEGSANEYKTNIITECNDKDGDIIEGVVCYEVLECSEKMKFLNKDECEDYLK